MTEDAGASVPRIMVEVRDNALEAFGAELEARCPMGQEPLADFLAAYAAALIGVAAEICVENRMPEDLYLWMAREAWRHHGGILRQ
jgi:hypothetical protein